jgi:hypothetical protein
VQLSRDDVDRLRVALDRTHTLIVDGQARLAHAHNRMDRLRETARLLRNALRRLAEGPAPVEVDDDLFSEE